MKKTIIVIAVLIVVGIGAYYIFFGNSYNQTPGNNSQTYTPPVSNNPNANIPVPASKSPATATASSVTVSIKNFSFNPPTLTVKTGTKVTWVNNDGVSHTVTSDSGTLLNSSTLPPGQSFSFTFTDPGSTTYHCSIHPTMKGTITIQN